MTQEPCREAAKRDGGFRWSDVSRPRGPSRPGRPADILPLLLPVFGRAFALGSQPTIPNAGRDAGKRLTR
jgi:hypothetical protein